jgi:hypothetical protein
MARSSRVAIRPPHASSTGRSQAHVGREPVVGLCNALVGVGCQGALIELAKVQSR